MTSAAVPHDAIPDDVTPPADPRRWRALGVLLLVQFMLILDVSIVNVALPTIGSDLDFTPGRLTWVVDAYVIVAGSLLLLGGRLGDLFGRRRVFTAGVVLFGLGSLACAMAPTSATLVAARFAQGGGEALAGPAAFGLIVLLFTDAGERGRAIGAFGGISGIAGTGGPILGGLLIEAGSWRWIFLINLPVVVAALIYVPRLVSAKMDRHDDDRGRGLDLIGAVLVTGGCLGIVYGCIEAASAGWKSATVIGPIVAGVVLLVAFVVSQRLVRAPLVPLGFFAERTRVAANLVTLFFYAVFFTQFFITALYLQQVQGWSALRAGLAFLPFGLAVGMSIGAATALQPRIGTKPLLLTGLALCGLATVLFTRLEPDGSYVGQVLPAMVVMALGSGLCLPTLATAAVHAVTGSDAGLAAGVQQALQQIGGAIGLAVLITLAVRSAASDVADGVARADATTDGYVLAFAVAAVISGFALLLAAVLVRNETPSERANRAPVG